MSEFKEKVLKVVSQIKEGELLSYKEVAKRAGPPVLPAGRQATLCEALRAGNKNAQRAVARILANNKNPEIPCHRVIKSNGEVGGYLGRKDLDWKKAGLLLKEGAIGVIPTDTLYGICTSAFRKGSVEKIYKLKKRDEKKPFIILISSFKDLEKFGVILSKREEKILKKIWPSKISVILRCPSRKFSYLHRGTKTLAFRLPKDELILKILKISGPIVAPSCNLEGERPARSIKEAKKYFKDKVFYLDRGILDSKPSTLIDLTKGKIKLIRKGAQVGKIKFLI